MIKAQLEEELEKVDPNVFQRLASDPDLSIWVGASAGTGKTKVLTDRVLRLLLPRRDGREGTPAHRILCLTFTKAAASEMALRVYDILGQWAIMDEYCLFTALEDLMGEVPTKAQCVAAQQLFAQIIDGAAGLRIMTLHSFCQSILGRFPLETGLPPHFQVMDERDGAALLKGAQKSFIGAAVSEDGMDTAQGKAVRRVLSEIDEAGFEKIIEQISKERRQVRSLFDRYGGGENIYEALCRFYNLKTDLTQEKITNLYCTGYDDAGLTYAAEILLQKGSDTGAGYGQEILVWLKGDHDEKVRGLQTYQNVFLTKDGAPRRRGFPSKAVMAHDEKIGDVLLKESERLAALDDMQKALKSAGLTRDFLIIGHGVLERYEILKNRRGCLDFDDLILMSLRLMQEKCSWVMYKLDEGLDHILVDEAQDTNPEQWKIVEALCAAFYEGLGTKDDIVRTSFVVGDIKQSIYGFQRAAPDEFKRMQNVFKEKISDAGGEFEAVSLGISFRTTQSVLRVVDRVFGRSDLSEAVGGGSIMHQSWREGQAGRVELWPLFETQKTQERDPWAMPIAVRGAENTSVQLAEYIADNIRNWLDRSEVLSTYGRAIEPGDIMILVRSRNALVDNIMRALRRRNIPVSGSDRMVLSEQLAVQDLIAVAQFCLCPEDDLALANVLKSPFIGLNEEALFSLCYNRQCSLWHKICHFEDSGDDVLSQAMLEDIRIYLAEWIGRVRQMGVYEFFNALLLRPCPAHEVSGFSAIKSRLGNDCIDYVQEFLSETLVYGKDGVDCVQGFVEAQMQSNVQIKREMEDVTGCVRIMTVHGAKGLQAPVVILPDTILSSSHIKPQRILWGEKTGLDFPLYSARKTEDSKKYSEVFSSVAETEMQEYYRLLYVAMTRAEERLYIAGYAGLSGGKEDSWYFKIKAAMEEDELCEAADEGVLRIKNDQVAPPDKSRKGFDVKMREFAFPDWCRERALPEMQPKKPFVPSRPSADEADIVSSPLCNVEQDRFLRGNLMHKLLQILPDLNVDVRGDVAQQFLLQHGGDFSEDARSDIVREVLNILHSSEFAKFFVSGSLAEVPVTAVTDNGQIISGQIDRLVIEDEAVWILDYKSNRPPPEHPKDVQPIYIKQLKAYRDVIAGIYPGRVLHCGLLWTDVPRLMVMDDYL